MFSGNLFSSISDKNHTPPFQNDDPVVIACVFRLFNDPVAMVFLYAAINAFADDRWSLGSLLYSLAVSVKMNILLFAPALFLAYLATQGIAGKQALRF